MRRILIIYLLLSAAMTVTGCLPKTPAQHASSKRQIVSKPIDLAKIRPNELGRVLILEYHDIGPKEERWARRSDNFRADLERLYKLGYYPVSLRDFVEDRLSVPAGKSPVVFTFDDGTAGQFRYIYANGKRIVDPDSAVGIMESFAKKHPDFPTRATFYVYYPVPFRDKKTIGDKFRHILELGMDIGNHTYTHTRLDTDSTEAARREMALNVKSTLSYAPGAKVDSIALPYGKGPKDKSILISGEYQGTRYKNIAALLVGAEPAPSPVSKKFDPYRLPRVQAIDSELDLWLGQMKRHPETRYVSDGDPNTVTVPKSLAEEVDRGRMKGLRLRTY